MDTGELSMNPDEMLGVTLQWTTILWGGGGGGVEILVGASKHRNRDELQLDGSLGSSVVPFIYK